MTSRPGTGKITAFLRAELPWVRVPETVDHEWQNLLVGLGVEQLIAVEQVLAALLVAIGTLGSQPVKKNSLKLRAQSVENCTSLYFLCQK